MAVEITYTSSRDCDYGDREVTEDVATFVDRNASLGKLVELLVEADILSVEQVFDAFKQHHDYAPVRVGDDVDHG